MKISSLAALLEQFDQDEELVIEIVQDDGESIITYDIGFDYSEFGEFMLRVHTYTGDYSIGQTNVQRLASKSTAYGIQKYSTWRR